MKAEHRHQLHTNALADRVNRIVKNVREAPRSTSVTVWAVLVLVVVTVVVWRFWSSAARSRTAQAWLRIDAALHEPGRGLSELSTLAGEDTGSIPSRTARFDVARISFQQGQAALISADPKVRAEAVKSLEEARDLYAKLAGQCADAPLLAQEALYSVAAAQESLAGSRGADSVQKDLEGAVAGYQQLASKHPDSPLGRSAKERAEALQSRLADVTRFYAELNQTTPPARTEAKER